MQSHWQTLAVLDQQTAENKKNLPKWQYLDGYKDWEDVDGVQVVLRE